MADESTSMRFFCRACKAEVVSDRVPTGWLALRRYRGGVPINVGLYCSEACLATWAGGTAELSRP
jgi:hypothetical protein